MPMGIALKEYPHAINMSVEQAFDASNNDFDISLTWDVMKIILARKS